jgi:hypothetical protein
MPKASTFPIIFDKLNQLSITFLSISGYLKPNVLQEGTVSWKWNGHENARITIQSNTKAEKPYIELTYRCNEAPINYKVQLVSVPSNLGKGLIWYFICPHTGIRCRKLHFAHSYFLHRSAFTGSLYEKQVWSRKDWALDKTMGAFLRSDNVREQLYRKHFKQSYRGKPTKKLLKLLKEIGKAGRVTLSDVNPILNGRKSITTKQTMCL